ncbi:hypothetical protein B0T18DRAFT_400202 [Schizothecium vesticola]|uniref:Uncharacterized protein n=1 Tax=Schizothecium vesticola TaxID=314040 RepID=A0AA40KD76_9PEZI|nr:hypothetical protein B0T18DRAFT_400202 [Schizothecium vesticola]
MINPLAPEQLMFGSAVALSSLMAGWWGRASAQRDSALDSIGQHHEAQSYRYGIESAETLFPGNRVCRCRGRLL